MEMSQENGKSTTPQKWFGLFKDGESWVLHTTGIFAWIKFFTSTEILHCVMQLE